MRGAVTGGGAQAMCVTDSSMFCFDGRSADPFSRWCHGESGGYRGHGRCAERSEKKDTDFAFPTAPCGAHAFCNAMNPADSTPPATLAQADMRLQFRVSMSAIDEHRLRAIQTSEIQMITPQQHRDEVPPKAREVSVYRLLEATKGLN